MRRARAAFALLLAVALTGGCGPGGGHEVRPSGSTRYFFSQLEQADALADYITLPRSLADTLPNRTYVSSRTARVRFTWSKRIVVGRVLSVSSAADHRVRLRLRIEESFPAVTRRTLEVLVAGSSRDENRYLASAASLDRVVVGVDSYRDDRGRKQTVVAMASQLIGVVDAQGRIAYPVLARSDFVEADWDQDMTTLAGLRREARAEASTISFG